MKLILTIAGTIILLMLLGCSKDTISVGEQQILAAPEEIEAYKPEPTKPDEPLEKEPSEVFDFAEFPEEYYPRGIWTVNQLIDRYGAYEEVTANYVSAYERVFVIVVFMDMSIHFFPREANNFSFYEASLEDGDYNLSTSDQDLALGILTLWVNDSSLTLPRGLDIERSTKTEVLNAYPKGTSRQYQSEGEAFYIDLVSYDYDFYDEDEYYPKRDDGMTGSVDYLFEESELLTRVNINWRYFDL